MPRIISEIENLENLINAKCKELNLISIDDLKINGQNSFAIFADILRKKNLIKEFPKNYGYDLGQYNDFRVISYNMQYIIGFCLLCKDYIFNEGIDGVYYQNLYDYRYLMYCNIGIQSIYNFWDRIGKILTYFYEVDYNSNKQTFGLIIDKLKGDFKQSENYKFLKNFKDSKYKEIIEIRHKIVHEFSIDAGHYAEFIFKSSAKDKSVLQEHYKKKINYINILIEHFKLFNIGFEKMLKLIDELPDKNK